MALIDELKEWRSATSAEMDRLEAAGREIDAKWKEQERLFEDLDAAIRALDPHDPPTDEEMFGDSDLIADPEPAREQLEREPEIEAAPADEQDDASEFAEPVEEAPALNADMQDEREQPVTDVAALIASGEHSYDEVAAIAYPEPQWNEPQPTEGYAPVTSPAADEAAKAHDWYDPKAVAERNRFNPFSIFRREDA